MGALTVFTNATVRTMDPARPVAGALAVRDGRLLAVGAATDVLRLRDHETVVVDLGGATVLPGFVDAHNHFAVSALEGFWANCRTPPLSPTSTARPLKRADWAGSRPASA